MCSPRESRYVTAAGVWQCARDDRVGEPLAACHPKPRVVQERSLAALGGEELVIGGIVDHSCHDGALALEPDRDREVRDAVQEVQRAVERIDDPAVGRVAADARSAFLAEEAVARPGELELLTQDLLGTPIRRSHEVGRSLERHLQMLDLAEIAFQHAAGLARGLDHHVEEGGPEHRVLGLAGGRSVEKLRGPRCSRIGVVERRKGRAWSACRAEGVKSATRAPP